MFKYNEAIFKHIRIFSQNLPSRFLYKKCPRKISAKFNIGLDHKIPPPPALLVKIYVLGCWCILNLQHRLAYVLYPQDVYTTCVIGINNNYFNRMDMRWIFYIQVYG